MFLQNRFTILLTALVFAAVFFTCTKKWDDHTQVTDPNLKINLYQAISKTSTLSKFSDMLVKTGYDKIISSSKTYTVWAPTDQALQTLDPAITGDTAKLKLFVANHISNQSYQVGISVTDQRILMVNGKYNILSGNKFDSANISTANQYANNGIFHIIDKFIPRYDNCWEFLRNSTSVPLMKNFLGTLDTLTRDFPVQTGVDPQTGLPVYQPGTGYVLHNIFLDSVMNVNDESNQYTLVLLIDNSYNTEFAKITPWFKTSTPDSTNKLSGYWLVKDLAFKGLYTPAQLPDTLVSQYGIKVPMNKANILASYKTSNGIVYVMNQVNFTKENKFPSIYIQGEFPVRFAADRTANTFYRVRQNPITGKNFNDIMLTNYGVANYFVAYYRAALNSMRYNAYWVAVNDIQSTFLWQQRLASGSIIKDTVYPNTPFTAVTVAYKNYNEVLLGQFNFATYNNQYFFVYGPTTSSTTGNVDAITLDYIRLEPAF